MIYHVKELPKVAWQLEGCFFIEGPQKWEWRNEGHQDNFPNKATDHTAFIDDLKGTPERSLMDKKGNVIFQAKRKLSEFIRCQGGHQPPCLYDSKTFFAANSSTEYVLGGSAHPDPALKDNDGYVLFSRGGWEPISTGF
jgi:hypothetical protein